MRDELRDDIRVTAENVIEDAKSITEIEEQKLDPNVTGDELKELSDEAMKLADDLVRKAGVEKKLVGIANAQDRLSRAAQRTPVAEV